MGRPGLSRPTRFLCRVRGLISLPFWLLGTLLCAFAAVLHWDPKASFRATSEMFDPDRWFD